MTGICLPSMSWVYYMLKKPWLAVLVRMTIGAPPSLLTAKRIHGTSAVVVVCLGDLRPIHCMCVLFGFFNN